jgi:hypothetical protein
MMTVTATLFEINDETMRADFECDGRLLSIPISKPQLEELTGLTGEFTITVERKALGVEEVGI